MCYGTTYFFCSQGNPVSLGSSEKKREKEREEGIRKDEQILRVPDWDDENNCMHLRARVYFYYCTMCECDLQGTASRARPLNPNVLREHVSGTAEKNLLSSVLNHDYNAFSSTKTWTVYLTQNIKLTNTKHSVSCTGVCGASRTHSSKSPDMGQRPCKRYDRDRCDHGPF